IHEPAQYPNGFGVGSNDSAGAGARWISLSYSTSNWKSVWWWSAYRGCDCREERSQIFGFIKVATDRWYCRAESALRSNQLSRSCAYWRISIGLLGTRRRCLEVAE